MSELNKRTNGNNVGVHPAIRDHYADMNAALHNRDALIQQVNDLQNALTVANGKAAYLEKQLEKMTQERDYYFRKSFAYTNTLVNMKNTVVHMLNLADHEAENPGPAQLTQTSTEQELINKVDDVTADIKEEANEGWNHK